MGRWLNIRDDDDLDYDDIEYDDEEYDYPAQDEQGYYYEPSEPEFDDDDWYPDNN